MDNVAKKLENQVQFWSLLGPFLVLLSMAILFFKVSVHWYFPVSALIGIPLCVKWKIKGMAGALCALLFLSGVGYQNLDLDDRYWHVGLAIAMAFSFVILTLSLEEADGLVGKLKLESQSRLDNYSLLDDKWKIAEAEWASEKEQSKLEIAALAQDIARTLDDKQTYYKLAQLSKEEHIQLRTQHEQLLKDLSYKKEQISQLHERLEETELTIQGFIDSDHEKHLKVFQDRFESVEKENELLKAKMDISQKEIQACIVQKDQLKHDLQVALEREKFCLLEKLHLQEHRSELEESYQKALKDFSLIEEEKKEILKVQILLESQNKDLSEQIALEKMGQQKILENYHNANDKYLSLVSEHSILEKKLDALEVEKRESGLDYLLLFSDLQRSVEELDQKKKDLEKVSEDYHHLHEKYNDLRDNHSSMKILKEKLESDLEQLQKKYIEEIDQWQSRFEKAHNSIQNEKIHLSLKSDELLKAHTDIENLKSELSQKQETIDKTYAELKELINQNNHLEENLKNLEKFKGKKRQEEHLPFASSNTRQIEAMYIQLKNQFQEKCNVLDETRKEHFKIKEELLKCQKEQDEERIYGLSANEKLLQKHILKLNKELEKIETLYQEEVSALSEFIKKLLT